MQEVQVQGTKALSTDQLNEWGAPVVSAQDIVIPKILAMQGLSVAVTEGRAQMGEFRDSINNSLVGSMDKPFECIPFYVDKAWDIMEEQADGSFKWKETVPVVENPMDMNYNDNWKWETEKNGLKQKNIRRFNFYVLLPQEVADGASVPYIFSFKSTSLKEGKKLFTQMYMRNIRAGQPPAAYHILIGGKREKNAKGVYIVPTYSLGAQTSPAEIKECLSWIAMIRSGKVKVDDSDQIELVLDTEPVGAEGVGEF